MHSIVRRGTSSVFIKNKKKREKGKPKGRKKGSLVDSVGVASLVVKVDAFLRPRETNHTDVSLHPLLTSSFFHLGDSSLSFLLNPFPLPPPREASIPLFRPLSQRPVKRSYDPFGLTVPSRLPWDYAN